MDNDFSALPDGSFPAYTLSNKNGQACQNYCALIWPAVLTSGRLRPATAWLSTRSGSS